MKFEESSGVNLYIDWTGEEEMNKMNVAYMLGRVDLPSIGKTTAVLK